MKEYGVLRASGGGKAQLWAADIAFVRSRNSGWDAGRIFFSRKSLFDGNELCVPGALYGK